MVPPIRTAGAALLLGVLASRAVAGDAWAPVGILAAATAVAAAWASRRRSARARWCAALAGVAFAAGVLRGGALGAGDLALPDLDVALVEGVATTGVDALRTQSRTEDEVVRRAMVRLDLGSADARVLLDLAGDAPLPDVLPGDRVRVVGRVRARDPPRTPGLTHARGRRPVLDVFAASLVRTDGPVGTGLHALRRAGERLRRVARERLRGACGGETVAYGVFLCLLTGERDGLPPEVARAFRDSGTAHLLAVSGLHLVLLVAVVGAVGRRVFPRRVVRRAGLPATAFLVILYAAVCRFETPVVRAAVFLLVTACGRAAGRRTSTFDHLALAAALVVGWDPDQIADTGFQLSFAAVAGIALFARRFRNALFPRLSLLLRFRGAGSARPLRFRRAIAQAFATSLAAQAATAPVVATAFGTSQPLGAFANLAAVPVFTVALPTALVLAIVGGAVTPLTVPLSVFATRVFVGVVEIAAAAPLSNAGLGRPPPILLGASAALLVAAALRPTWTRRDLLLPAAAWSAVALAPAALAPPAQPEAVVLDVGHGLCVLVRSAEGTALLYDAGGRNPMLGDRVVVPALRAMGVRHLAFLCLSHEDSDHCGAAADVLREVAVDRVVVPAGFGASPLAQDVLRACAAARVPVTHALDGDAFAAAGIRARVLGPAAEAARGAENADSLVLHVRVDEDGPSLLLPGDLEDDDVFALAERTDLGACDVILLPHHGRGDAAPHDTLRAASRAAVWIASESDAGAVAAPGAWVTGLSGSIRVRSGGRLDVFPWPDH